MKARLKELGIEFKSPVLKLKYPYIVINEKKLFFIKAKFITLII